MANSRVLWLRVDTVEWSFVVVRSGIVVTEF